MRVRYFYAKKMEATSDESRAAEDLAMIFAYALPASLVRMHKYSLTAGNIEQTPTPFPLLFTSSSSSFAIPAFSSEFAMRLPRHASTTRTDSPGLTSPSSAKAPSYSPSSPKRCAFALPLS